MEWRLSQGYDRDLSGPEPQGVCHKHDEFAGLACTRLTLTSDLLIAAVSSHVCPVEEDSNEKDYLDGCFALGAQHILRWLRASRHRYSDRYGAGFHWSRATQRHDNSNGTGHRHQDGGEE